MSQQQPQYLPLTSPGGMHNISPLRGSGRMQMSSSNHALNPAGLVGQRHNEIMTAGPAQNE